MQMSPARPERPADRYGRAASQRTRRLVIGAGILVVLAVVAWFGWAAYASRGSATGTDIGFRVVNDASVDVTFDVTKPAGKTATCVIEALDSGFAVVGTTRVQIGPSTHGVARQTVTVRTTNRATTGRVDSCSVDH
jgi:hypothetical protein